MKSLFAQYGTASPITLKLYTDGTEDVAWVKGIDSVTGSGNPGSSGGSYVEGGSYITIALLSEPLSLGIEVDIAGVTNSTVDITGYIRVYVDWEVLTNTNNEISSYLIVSGTKNGDIDTYDARLGFGEGTGRKTSVLAINSLTGSKYIRVNANAFTVAPAVEQFEMRIHRVWLEK